MITENEVGGSGLGSGTRLSKQLDLLGGHVMETPTHARYFFTRKTQFFFEYNNRGDKTKLEHLNSIAYKLKNNTSNFIIIQLNNATVLHNVDKKQATVISCDRG